MHTFSVGAQIGRLTESLIANQARELFLFQMNLTDVVLQVSHPRKGLAAD